MCIHSHCFGHKLAITMAIKQEAVSPQSVTKEFWTETMIMRNGIMAVNAQYGLMICSSQAVKSCDMGMIYLKMDLSRREMKLL